MTIPIQLVESRIAVKIQEGSLEPPPYSPDLTPNLGSKYLSGTRLSSNSDVKTAAENCGRDFYQVGLSKLVLRPDKYLNRFCDYDEK
ncbi:hypothetical protein AVEN_96072-1 [Araneus ventricosus]|uniref:Tc1-like transposase DDE domain-containing protein n=1 Tax=Araneus ventricosus TaxID=182803 RepID=A0A4Y2B4W1_ARAVE|nr:hypothetical protein AVEN_96072-1 [Araneus ventricosus]